MSLLLVLVLDLPMIFALFIFPIFLTLPLQKKKDLERGEKPMELTRSVVNFVLGVHNLVMLYKLLFCL